MAEQVQTPEWEGKGVDYERYAMYRLFVVLVKRFGWQRVLEIPAGGEKAMPSLYSLPFGAMGCQVTLANPVARSLLSWERLGYPVTSVVLPDITATGLEAGQFDLVWNFMTLARVRDKEALVQEMARLTSKQMLFVAVNRFNLGFFSHRMVHRYSGIVWNHGDVAFMNPFYTRRWLQGQGVRVVAQGVVDAPPYPDSLGFRDLRLHRRNEDLHQLAWESRTVDWMQKGVYPRKLFWLSLGERLPLPWPLKLFYAHLFWIVVEKVAEGVDVAGY
ncbi:MAG: class I SAM-dependent methyltransferase [Magnetococcus sp. DMHC-6]